jgi:methyl-accepting chemotaxis protein
MMGLGMRSTERFSLGIRGRILLLFGLCTAVLLSAATYGFWQYSASVDVFVTNVKASQANAVDVLVIETNFKKQVQEWKDTLLRGKKPEALDKHWNAFQQRESDVSKAAERMKASVADKEAAQLIGQFLAAHKEMGEAYRRGLQKFKESGFDSAVGDTAVAGIDRAPTELLGKARERFIAVADREAKQAAEGAQRTAWIVALLLAVSTVAGAAIFMIAAQRSISQPLMRVVVSLSELAGGNTATEVSGQERGDEIGEVAAAIQVLKEKMIEAERMKADQIAAELRAAEQRRSDMVRVADDFESAVGQIVETVSMASRELETSAGALAATAERAQELSNSVAGSSEVASTNVQSVAAATEQLSSSVSEIGRQIQETARIAREAVGQARATTEHVNGLSKAASRIGDVVELINNIAGQTNLLALNATIEAARAGEAGRGFAVVASEVKALAEQTSKATGEIGQQIADIQAATNQSVGAIDHISGTIEQLSEIAATIATAVEQQGSATQEISRNVQQAASGTQQVSASIVDVQRGAGETGSASSQVLSSARALASESRRLKSEMGRFLGTVRSA